MRRLGTAFATLFACGCTVNTDPLVGPDGASGGGDVYTRAEVDRKIDEKVAAALQAQVGFLADCKAGDVLLRSASGWTCSQNPPCPPGFAYTAEGSFTVCSRMVSGVET